MGNMKKSKKQVRVYLDSEEEGILGEALKTHEKLTESDLMTWLSSAGLKALRENNYRLTLPLKMEVVEDFQMMRERPKNSRDK